jgi:hypothetical protein
VTLGLVVLAAGLLMTALLTLLMGHDSKIEFAASRVLAEVKMVNSRSSGSGLGQKRASINQSINIPTLFS